MSKCLVCGQETGSKINCQVCGAVVESPFFLNREEYERWAKEVLLPAQEAWKQKKTEQGAALKRNTPGTLSKERFHQLVNLAKKDSIKEIRILSHLSQAADLSNDLSEEQNRSVLGWKDESVLYLAGEGRIKLPRNCSELFAEFPNMEQIEGAEVLDTSGVTDLSSLFNNSWKLKNVDVSQWDTSNVTNMEYTFYHCSSLRHIDVSGWNTSRVTNMCGLFGFCYNLSTIETGRWNTSNVKNMGVMFFLCGALKDIDTSRWDTSSVTSMNKMFANCSSLTTLHVSQWDTSHVTDMSFMFQACTNLSTLNATNWNTRSVKLHGDMFDGVNLHQKPGIRSPRFSEEPTPAASSTRTVLAKGTLDKMRFLSLTNPPKESVREIRILNQLDGAPPYSEDISEEQNRSVLTWSNYRDVVFLAGEGGFKLPANCGDLLASFTALERVVGTLDAEERVRQKAEERARSAARRPKGTLDKARFLSLTNPQKKSVREIRVLNQLDGAPAYSEDISEEQNRSVLTWSNYRDVVFLAGEGGVRLPGDCSELFKDFSALERIVGAELLDTSHVANMSSMFSRCKALKALDVGRWNTSCVTSMYAMFEDCSSLATLDVSRWNTSKVTDMQRMFKQCTSLRHLNASGWNTGSVKKHEEMFEGVNLSQNPGIKLPRFGVEQAEREVAERAQREAEERARRKALEEKLQQARERARREAEERIRRRAQEEKAQQERERARREAEERTKRREAEREAAERRDKEQTFRRRLVGTLSKKRFCRFCNWLKKGSVKEIRIQDKVNRAPTHSVDISEEQNRSVLGWMNEGVLNLAGEGGIKAPRDSSKLFKNYTSLQQIVGAQLLDTSTVTDMKYMFHMCGLLKTIDVGQWDTSNVTNMEGLFCGCHSITALDVGTWNTSRVTNMFCMFLGCSSLTALDLSRWNTANVVTTQWMFYDCFSLSALIVNRWDTSNVKNMQEMFKNCTNLRTLNASGWNTKKAKRHSEMFEGINLSQRPGIQLPRF